MSGLFLCRRRNRTLSFQSIFTVYVCMSKWKYKSVWQLVFYLVFFLIYFAYGHIHSYLHIKYIHIQINVCIFNHYFVVYYFRLFSICCIMYNGWFFLRFEHCTLGGLFFFFFAFCCFYNTGGLVFFFVIVFFLHLSINSFVLFFIIVYKIF